MQNPDSDGTKKGVTKTASPGGGGAAQGRCTVGMSEEGTGRQARPRSGHQEPTSQLKTELTLPGLQPQHRKGCTDKGSHSTPLSARRVTCDLGSLLLPSLWAPGASPTPFLPPGPCLPLGPLTHRQTPVASWQTELCSRDITQAAGRAGLQRGRGSRQTSVLPSVSRAGVDRRLTSSCGWEWIPGRYKHTWSAVAFSRP